MAKLFEQYPYRTPRFVFCKKYEQYHYYYTIFLTITVLFNKKTIDY